MYADADAADMKKKNMEEFGGGARAGAFAAAGSGEIIFRG